MTFVVTQILAQVTLSPLTAFKTSFDANLNPRLSERNILIRYSLNHTCVLSIVMKNVMLVNM